VFRNLALNPGGIRSIAAFATVNCEDDPEELAQLSVHDSHLAGQSPVAEHPHPVGLFLSPPQLDTDDSAISCELQSAFSNFERAKKQRREPVTHL